MKNQITRNFVNQTMMLYDVWIQLNPNDEIGKEVLKECLILENNDADYIYNENPILDLIHNYTVERFDIGRIHFYSIDELESDEEYIIVGSDGAGEFISIQKNTDKIYLLDGY